MTGSKNIPAEKVWIAYVVFVAGILLTIAASYFIHQTLQARSREEFHTSIAETEARIRTRIEAYIALLRGAGGLYAVNGWVEPDQFRLFFYRLRTREFYPGVQGLGYAARVTPENRNTILERVRRTNANFTIQPPPNGEESYPITILEPQDERNQAAMGFDMFSEPIRRNAMIRARDTGLPAATGRVTLVQEIDENKQSGFLIYLPVYASGTIPTTPEARRKAIQGFIYAPFRAEDFLESIAAEQRGWDLRFQVFDGEKPTEEALIFDSAALEESADIEDPALRKISVITIAGQPWTIRFYAAGSFSGISRLFPIVPATGLLLSFILFYLTQAEARARYRSEQSLMRLQHSQAALEASEELHRTVTETASDGIIVADENGRIQNVNAAVEKILGYPKNELLNEPLTKIFPEHMRAAHVAEFRSFTHAGRLDGSAICLPGLRKDGTEVPLEISYGSFSREGKIFVTGILRDISQRVKAEAAARASQQQLETIADALPVLIASVDKNLRFLFSNRTYEKWFGQTSEQIQSRSVSEVIGAETYSRITQHIEAALAGREISFETTVLTPKTGLRQVHGTIIPNKNEDGSVAGLFFLVLDISERKRQEDAAMFIADIGKAFAQTLTYESTLRTIAEKSVPRIADWCMVTLLNPDGSTQRILSNTDAASEAMATVLVPTGGAMNEVTQQVIQLGQPFFLADVDEEFLTRLAPSPGQVDLLRKTRFRSLICAPMRGRRRIYGIISLATTNGGRAYTQADAALAEELASRAGLAIENALLYEEAQQEIKERRIVEHALRESEERFRIMVEQARDYAIFMLDSEGRISSWNAGAERILGYSESEILGQHSSIVFTPEDRADGVPEKELTQARTAGHANEERWHMRKDSSRFYCSDYMFALRSPTGELRGFTKIMRDITERKKWEEDIKKLNTELESRVEQRTAALRDSYEQMETFTYTVAHDLRAPLRSMLGFSEAILEESAHCLDATSKDFLHRIVRASHRMDSLIQDLLAYSHITRTDLKFEAIPLQSVLDDVLHLIADDLQKKNVTVAVHPSLPTVHGHRATLHTIVFNLVTNAVKFSSRTQSPRVQIKAETVVHDSQKFVRFWVIDNGIGIAPEHHERIFRVFERLHSSESYTGTGIGLAIVKKGVERMGGRVGLESKLNEGSRFWIELPAA